MEFDLMRAMWIRTYILMLAMTSGTLLAQEETLIDWERQRPLEWSDFKGKPVENSHKAETHWRMDVYYDNAAGGYQVNTQFDTQKSWVKQGFGSDQLLIHEQGHFDLAEIYARQFRRDLDSLVSTSQADPTTIGNLFNQTLADCDQVQKDYDDETQHGLIPEAQRKWTDYIAAELNKPALTGYSE